MWRTRIPLDLRVGGPDIVGHAQGVETFPACLATERSRPWSQCRHPDSRRHNDASRRGRDCTSMLRHVDGSRAREVRGQALSTFGPRSYFDHPVRHTPCDVALWNPTKSIGGRSHRPITQRATRRIAVPSPGCNGRLADESGTTAPAGRQPVPIRFGGAGSSMEPRRVECRPFVPPPSQDIASRLPRGSCPGSWQRRFYRERGLSIWASRPISTSAARWTARSAATGVIPEQLLAAAKADHVPAVGRVAHVRIEVQPSSVPLIAYAVRKDRVILQASGMSVRPVCRRATSLPQLGDPHLPRSSGPALSEPAEGPPPGRASAASPACAVPAGGAAPGRTGGLPGATRQGAARYERGGGCVDQQERQDSMGPAGARDVLCLPTVHRGSAACAGSGRRVC